MLSYQSKSIPVKVHNIAVDSRMRDKDKYPSTTEYVIELTQPFKNVVSVKLVHAIYEKFGTEMYVNLFIDELSPNLISNNNIVSGSFTQLPLIEPLNIYTQDMFESVKTFDQPLSKLSKLSIHFYSYDGSPYPIKDHYLKFEVRCCKFDGHIENRKMEIISDHVEAHHVDKRSLNGNGNAFEKMLGLTADSYSLDGLIASYKRQHSLLVMKNAKNDELVILKNAFKTLAQQFKSI